MAFTINPPNTALVDERGMISPVWYRFFANIQRILGDDPIKQFAEASVVTFAASPVFSNERILAGSAAIRLVSAAPLLTIELRDTTVAPGSYGDAAKTIALTVDQQGRITAAQEFDLNTSNIAEGAKLFHTDARARAAISGVGGISYDAGTGEASLDTGNARNVDHSAVRIAAGAGLIGGGTIDEDRTLALNASGVTPGTYASPTSITVDEYGRITAIS